MEWLSSFVVGITLFVSGLVPSFGREVSYFMTRIVPPPHVSIVFGGDMMFDRTIRTAMREHGDDHIFSCITATLKKADLVVANLEGPITNHESVSEGSIPAGENNYTFTFPPSTAPLLKRHNISLVNLGNNHMLNFSREGLLQTKEYLTEAHVRYFGDPDSGEAERVARIRIYGVPFSFVNWSDWTSDKTDHTVQQVQKEAELGRVVVVYTHWGEEYVPATKRMKTLAHQFVDAGASIVIGSHPHVVQEHEVYEGKHIYYSLGNFVFDQYFADAVMNGLLLDVEFERTGVVRVKEIPITLGKDRRTCLAE